MTSHQDLLNHIAKIKEELVCTICTGVIDDPHALVCGHAFCGVCILQWLPTKKVCPVCRVAVMRQPVHVNMIQKLSDLFKALDGTKSIERLTREHWKELFPVETQSTFIQDIDQDGIIHRCSQCGWELDEDNFCENCQINFEGEINQTIQDDSDHGSHFDQEEEEDLSGFVVNDDEPMLYSDSSQSMPPSTIEINDSDEERLLVRRSRQNRVIALSDDEDDSGSSQSEPIYDIPNSDQEDEDIGSDSLHYHGPDIDEEDEDEEEEEDDDDEEEEEEERYIHRQKRSRYIDDFAEEDDDDDEVITQPKSDPFTDSITRAISQMKTTKLSQPPVDVDSSSDTSSDDSDAPDYENMTAPLSSSQGIYIDSQPTTTQQQSPPQPETKEPQESQSKQESSSQKKRKHKQKRK